MTTNEMVTPAPMYVSIGDRHGIPTPWAGETDAMRGNSRSPPAKYERLRTEQAEGARLLQGGGRPVVQRKEVSRKPVRGQGHGSERL